MPFSTVLKGNKSFEWGEVQSRAFKELKEHLHNLPTLARPITGETLYLYISSTQHTVSAVLIREENKIQYPIFRRQINYMLLCVFRVVL